jgi:polyphenol oxidase
MSLTAATGPATGELLFELPGDGRALFTTRAHGNMSSVSGPHREHGLRARERLRVQLGLRRLARGHQVHGTTVRRIHEEAPTHAPGEDAPQPSIEADGHATRSPAVGVMALAADCLPVALGCDGAIAMIHTGWRGLAAGVLEQGVLALRELGGAGEISAILGPGAGPCCYEVGEEVHAAFADARRTGRHIDLKGLARDRLRAAGVAHVRDLELCTICDERFFSHRREAACAGRQAGVAWLA